MKVFKVIAKAVPVLFKTRKVVREARELGQDVVELRAEVERVLQKWSHLPDVMDNDVAALVKRLDDVTESAADVVGELGAGKTEKWLREFIDE